MTLIGFALGAQPIADNSTFVHLRTGIDIVAGRGIPRADPYSFTADGAPWVVQSWLPSTVYGALHRVGGDGLLLLFQGILTAVLAATVFRLARGGGGRGIPVALTAVVALSLGATYWSPRPLLFGIACLGAVILVTLEERAGWLLVPIAWVWVSSHGSFPLGALWLGAHVVGSAVDSRSVPTAALRRAGWFVVGLAVACINPLGARLLQFPFVLGDRAAVFKEITEWRSPDFQSPFGLINLVGLLAVVLLVGRRRLPWASLLPLAGFVAMGLFAVRNLAPLTIVAAGALGRGAGPAAVADERSAGWRPLDRAMAVVLACTALFVGVDVAGSPALRFDGYPVAVVREGTRTGTLAPGRRIAASDKVGCYLILVRGRAADVFVDDRYDMYPVSVSDDYTTLLRARPGSLDVLQRHRIDAVLWRRSLPLVPLLRSEGWSEVGGDEDWVVLEPA